MALVIDASAIAPLTLGDEDARYANRVLSQVEQEGFAWVPRLFFEELGNVLVVNERRGRIDPATSDVFLAMVRQRLSLRTFEISDMAAPVRLAREFGLSVYDAVYLSCAISTHSRLATQDKSLATAALASGVGLLPFEE
ncbi:tRNA(fMet)-specific endonuclease VapC [Pirellulimonas nuda]|uniref:tRNA(fMet)-specific endonuclease VapC n=1 Tax=Pirellulimonas nuda TaxID=2528009 RepID=A0A518DJT8_9BACT|nr:type II toxin-antitoxin system VapC family toxin [Pirellulimonas nuda]QDU91744.1 tRNA(fMet)-specific endonuclease VapC [Pirellulimonas nuda]